MCCIVVVVLAVYFAFYSRGVVNMCVLVCNAIIQQLLLLQRHSLIDNRAVYF